MALEAGIQLALLFNQFKNCDDMFYSNDIIRCILTIGALKYMYMYHINIPRLKDRDEPEHTSVDEIFYTFDNNIYEEYDVIDRQIYRDTSLPFITNNDNIRLFINELKSNKNKNKFIFCVFTKIPESYSFTYYQNDNNQEYIYYINTHKHSENTELGVIILKFKNSDNLFDYIISQYNKLQTSQGNSYATYKCYQLKNKLYTYNDYLTRNIQQCIEKANENILEYYNYAIEDSRYKSGRFSLAEYIIQKFAFNQNNQITNLDNIYMQVALCINFRKKVKETEGITKANKIYDEEFKAKGYIHNSLSGSSSGGSLLSHKKLLLKKNRKRIEEYLKQKGISQNIFFRYLYGIEENSLFHSKSITKKK
jgi:hypothetical protein